MRKTLLENLPAILAILATLFGIIKTQLEPKPPPVVIIERVGK
jgi:hypothetical protein